MIKNKLLQIINNKLFKSAGIYTVTGIINKAIPFFLLPILTRYLSPSDYGIVSMFGVLVSFTNPFIGLSINGAIARAYYEKYSLDIREYIANSLLILLSSTLLVSIVFFFFSGFIAQISSVPSQILWMVIVVSFGHFITAIVLTLWQVQVKPRQYGIYQISNTLLNLILSLLFVVVIGLSWRGRLYAQIITAFVFVILGGGILYRNSWLKFKFNKTYIKHALLYGLPLIPHGLGGVIITMTDRVFITNMVGIETTGVYTVGYQIGMIINLLATAFHQAYIPWLYAKLNEDDHKVKRKIVKFTYVYFAIILILSIGLSSIAPYFLSIIVGKEFAQSSIYVVWIAIGYAFNGMYLMVVNYIFYAKKNYILSIVTFASAMINIILNYFFIRSFGAIGAAQATTLIYLLKFISVWLLSAKVYKMPWKEVFQRKVI